VATSEIRHGGGLAGLAQLVAELGDPTAITLDVVTRLIVDPPAAVSAIAPKTSEVKRIFDLITADSRADYLATAARCQTEGMATTIVTFNDDTRARLDLVDLTEELGLQVALLSPATSEAETEAVRAETSFRPAVSGVLTTSANGMIAGAEDVLCELFSWDANALAGTTALESIHPDDYGDVLLRWAEMLDDPGRAVHIRTRTTRGDGSWGWTDLVACYRPERPEDSACEIVMVDVNNEIRALAMLRDQARRDPLTGLANRRSATQRLESLSGPSAVIFADLVGFKRINDALGHKAGDALLTQIAPRIVGEVRPRDLVARIGGDEFVVISEGCASVEEAVAIAERLIAAIAQPTLVNGRLAHVSASVGVAHSLGEVDGDVLLNRADHAMYVAKRSATPHAVVFDAEMAAAMERTAQLGELLRTNPGIPGLAAAGLDLQYQPIVSALQGRAIGAEALLRWTTPNGAVLPAEIAIATIVAEGRVHDLAVWSITSALDHLVQIKRGAGLTNFNVSVNLSADQLTTPNLVGIIATQLELHEVSPDELTLELSEANRVGKVEGAGEVLAALATLGVGLSLDDFGTSWSRFDQLLEIDATSLKLARSVTRTVEHPRSEALIGGLVDIARRMELTVVADGVETADDARWLSEIGVDLHQGWLHSPAIPHEDLAAALASGAFSTPSIEPFGR